MIEGCSGGGGRFDAGMLYYCPQIWCSDDTDAIERLEIQRGTSYGYPVSAMGAHVSASPNHQTGRCDAAAHPGHRGPVRHLRLRAEPGKADGGGEGGNPPPDRGLYRYAGLIAQGDYYRLNELDDGKDYSAWMFAARDGSEALVNLVMTHVRANGPFPYVKLKGLMPEAVYRLEGTERICTGAALMYGGYSFPPVWGDYPAHQLHFIRI